MKITFYLIIFFVTLVLRFSLYLFKHRKKGKKKNKKIEKNYDMEQLYLIRKFNLDDKKILSKGVALGISFIDSFIITITIMFAFSITDNVILELLIGLVIAFILIYVCNELYGRFLVKKGFGKDE